MTEQELQKYTTQAYSAMRHKSKRRGHPTPKINKEELKVWLLENGVERIWDAYIESGRDKYLKPSINRLNDYKTYSFNNMELVTWRENFNKAVIAQKHMKMSIINTHGRPVSIFKNGKLIRTFKSEMDASRWIGCHNVSVHRAAKKQRKKIKGYTVEFVNEEQS